MAAGLWLQCCSSFFQVSASILRTLSVDLRDCPDPIDIGVGLLSQPGLVVLHLRGDGDRLGRARAEFVHQTEGR